MAAEEGLICKACGFHGVDVRLVGCGCTLHARCVPLNLLATKNNSSISSGSSLSALSPNTVACPCCRSATVEGLYLFPITLQDLDRAVQLRKKTAAGASDVENENGKRDNNTMAFLDVQAESSYLLLSHQSAGNTTQSSNSVSLGADYQRTGRWTEEETAYVDFLLEIFDRGQLPVPEDMRLNDFLRDILLCKSSRLTKKMKHAKLSSRCFTAKLDVLGERGFDRQLFSTLEDRFLKSVNSEASRLELKFNLTRVWRTLLSNFCLQIGSSLLFADDWIASLEVMERRAVAAEETIRKARRERMGLALKTDSRYGENGVFFSGVPVAGPEPKKQKVAAFARGGGGGGGGGSGSNEPPLVGSSSVCSEASFDHSKYISHMLDLGAAKEVSHRSRDSFDDFTMILTELASDDRSTTSCLTSQSHQANNRVRNSCGPFLEAIASLMESENLPFDHVDVWVPSFDPKASGATNQNPEKNLRLYHAGYATRRDLDPAIFCNLNEYGEYSTRFSFASGVGLPGRVFATGEHVWERHIDEADPKFFERAGGAKVYGIKTGLGFAISTKVIGRMVVSMYSTLDLLEDTRIVQLCKQSLDQYSPEPKWKLVIDMAPAPDDTMRGSLLPSLPGRTACAVDHHDSGSSNTANSDPLGALPAMQPSSLSAGSVCTSVATSVPTMKGDIDEEHRIAVLLGDHIPLAELPGGNRASSFSAPAPTGLIPHFMSLRLLLLRSPSRRSDEENEFVEIIRKSFLGYAQGGRRSDKDVALLLVQDWMYLSGTHQADAKMPAKQDETYQCHVMEPRLSSYAASGAPTRMPSFVGSPGVTKIRSSSFESTTEVHDVLRPDGPLSRVNIVHEH